MDITIVLFIIGGLATTLAAVFAWVIRGYERRISRLEMWREDDQKRISTIELDIKNRLVSLEAKIDRLIND